MQYAFITLALTAATLALPTKREEGVVPSVVGTATGLVNVGGVTSSLGLKRDVINGVIGDVDETLKDVNLGVDVKRALVDDVVTDIDETVTGLNLKRGLVSVTVGDAKQTVGDLDVTKTVADLSLKRDVEDTVTGLNLGGTVKGLNGFVSNSVGGTVDTVDGLNVVKRGLVSDTVGGLTGTIDDLNVDKTVDGLNVVKRGLVSGTVDDVESTVDGLNVDGTVGDLNLKREIVSGVVSDLTDTVDGLDLNVKRQVNTGSGTLSLESGLIDSLLGNENSDAGDALAIGSGTASPVISKREIVDTDNLDINALLASLNDQQLGQLTDALKL